jgi:hypothetical protein
MMEQLCQDKSVEEVWSRDWDEFITIVTCGNYTTTYLMNDCSILMPIT